MSKEAFELLQIGVNKYPNNISLLNTLADTYTRLIDKLNISEIEEMDQFYDMANGYYLRSYKINSHLYRTNYGLALTYYNKGANRTQLENQTEKIMNEIDENFRNSYEFFKNCKLIHEHGDRQSESFNVDLVNNVIGYLDTNYPDLERNYIALDNKNPKRFLGFTKEQLVMGAAALSLAYKGGKGILNKMSETSNYTNSTLDSYNDNYSQSSSKDVVDCVVSIDESHDTNCCYPGQKNTIYKVKCGNGSNNEFFYCPEENNNMVFDIKKKGYYTRDWLGKTFLNTNKEKALKKLCSCN